MLAAFAMASAFVCAGPIGPSKELTSGIGLQCALERAGFSAGIIDGQPGRKTQIALMAFQRYRGLPVTGKLDSETRAALGIDERAGVKHYRITAEDVKMVAPPPKDWNDKAKAGRLGYYSLADLVAERGHCSEALLARLNPKKNMATLQVGDDVVIPDAWSSKKLPRAARLDVDVSQKTIAIIDDSGRTAGLLHCSIAKEKKKVPKGSCRVASVSHNPDYLFDPAMWPEVKNVKQKLRIPSGPRSPVGLCWIGLSLPGYGIHGTPEPEMIGKTGSHGCFRLTNWDAKRLAQMVRVGTPVQFRESPNPAFSASR